MPRCLPPVRICTETRLEWCLCCALDSGMLTWPRGRRVVMVWLWFNTEPVSEQEVTTDHCHPLVGPYKPLVQGMLGREREMTREVEWCFCLLQNCVELYVYVYSCSCLAGIHAHGHVQKFHAYAHKLNMFQYSLLRSACHVCMYVRFVTTRDKYTCSKPTGWSLDCARSSRIRAVIFHIYTLPTWVYLEGRFYEDKCPTVPCVFVCVCTVCIVCRFTHSCLQLCVFLHYCLFNCLQLHSRGSSSFFLHLNCCYSFVINLFSSWLSKQISTPMKSDSTTFSLHFHL